MILAARWFLRRSVSPNRTRKAPRSSRLIAILSCRAGPRAGPHPAVDFGGKIGDPVLAAADGVVYGARSGGLCGNGIRLAHPPFSRYTLYCQLHTIGVKKGDAVKRGQVIGTLGASGEPSMRAKIYFTAIPMLHFMLSERPERRVDGQVERTYDPMQFIVGCFDPAKKYPTDRLVLTYPLKCD